MLKSFAKYTAVLALAAMPLRAQEHDHVANANLHMEMTPLRHAAPGDSVRAAQVARELKVALAPYQDTTVAVRDGYHMFLPQLKEQKVYHFTSNWRGLQEAFRFDPAKPTSLLYKKGVDGRLVLVGAMYTAPKRYGGDKLNERVPLSIARWHKHVNWCLPPKGETERWLERREGMPLFGPDSPIASEKECKAVGGNFHDTMFGWMLHANVMESSDPSAIWGDEHAGHDMHAAMKADPNP